MGGFFNKCGIELIEIFIYWIGQRSRLQTISLKYYINVSIFSQLLLYIAQVTPTSREFPIFFGAFENHLMEEEHGR